MISPLLFLIFNRPETTEKVFNEIKKIKPKKLYIAADGPRVSVPGDVENCQKSRRITESIDWKCEVKRLYREDNLGCRLAVSSAIDWFFENEEEGIVLEDDCLPDQSFFKYCTVLLDRFRKDKKIMIICGDNFQNNIIRGRGNYYFSKFTHIWGWATWRSRWKRYDVEMKDWPENRRKNVIAFDSYLEKLYWKFMFDKIYKGKIDTWDYQLLYASMKNECLNVIPNVNLVENIGHGIKATHTTNKAVVPKSGTMSFPLKEISVSRDREADIYTEKHHYRLNLTDILKKLIFSILGT